MWVFDLKTGIKHLIAYLKRPYNLLRVLPAADRFGFWHAHICLPLRLGKEVFEYACPYAKDKDFVYEYMDECEYCPYFAILSGENGKVTLNGDSRFLDVRDPISE